MNLEKLKLDNDIKILITGCAGFIGSNLLEFFLSKSLKVKGLDNLSTGTKKNIDDAVNAAGKKQKKVSFEFIKGDIRNLNDCKKSTENVDIVLHHAALGSVQRSIDNPIDSNTSNINGTLNLLKTSVENKVKKFIYSSSSSVYGDTEILPKTEEMPPNPKSIYAVTKLTAEYYCRLFHDLYGLKTITFRYFNVFGKRQDSDSIYAAVIPKFINNILNSKDLIIYGDGTQSRDFTYIDNIIYGNYLAIITNNEKSFGNFYNIACNNNITLNKTITLLSKYFRKEIKPIYNKPRKGDIKHSLASIDKIGKDLKYEPMTYFKDGLDKSIEWFIKSKDYFNK